MTSVTSTFTLQSVSVAVDEETREVSLNIAGARSEGRVTPVFRSLGNYSLAATDANTQQVVTAAAVITVPANTLPVGSIVGIIAQTAGAVSILASGVTINTEVGLILNAQNATAGLYCSATNVFTLAGSLKAV